MKTISDLLKTNSAFNFEKEAYLYVRMSTDAQLDGNSLERQIESGFSYAQTNKLRIMGVLEDIGLSAYSGVNLSKGKLGEFIDNAKSGTIPSGTVLIVESLDRLSRKHVMDSMPEIFEIMRAGIVIHSHFDNQIYDEEGFRKDSAKIINLWVRQGTAFEESKKKSNRGLSNWDIKYKNLDKKIATARCPAWLEVNKERTAFIPIPSRVQTIRTIFDLCIDQNMGVYQITAYLNKHPELYPRFTKPLKKYRLEDGSSILGWGSSYVTKILNNPAVYGEFTPHKMHNGKRIPRSEPIQGYFPAIITYERFLLAKNAQSERAVQGGGRKGESFRNLFTKKLHCERCGAPIHFINKGPKPKGGTYLTCYNVVSKGNCDAVSWRYDDFEQAFLRFISEIDLQSVFLTPHHVADKKLLEESLVTINEKILILEETVNHWLDLMHGDAAALVRTKFDTAACELEAFKKHKITIQSQLQKFDIKIDRDYQENLVKMFYKNQNSLNEHEKASIRRQINKLICLIIDDIKISTEFDHYYAADEISIPQHDIQILLKNYNLKLEDLPSFLLSKQGQRVWQDSQRTFTVSFKNGFTKVVKPFFEKSGKYDLSKNIKFHQRLLNDLLKQKTFEPAPCD